MTLQHPDGMKFMHRSLECSTRICSEEFLRSEYGRSIYVQRADFFATCEFMDYQTAVAWCAILNAIATAEDPTSVSIDDVKAHVARIIEETIAE